MNFLFLLNSGTGAPIRGVEIDESLHNTRTGIKPVEILVRLSFLENGINLLLKDEIVAALDVHGINSISSRQIMQTLSSLCGEKLYIIQSTVDRIGRGKSHR